MTAVRLALELVELLSLALMTFAFIKEFRFPDDEMLQELIVDDLRLLVPALTLSFAALSFGAHALAWSAAALMLAGVTALWLDALLFRFFSLELQLELSVAIRAIRALLGGFGRQIGAREKILADPLFAVLPIAFAIAVSGQVVDDPRWRLATLLGFGLYAVLDARKHLSLYSETRSRWEIAKRLVEWPASGLFAVFVICALARLVPTSARSILVALLAVVGGALSLSRPRGDGREVSARATSYLRGFLGALPLADEPTWTPRVEHLAMLASGRRGQTPSSRFGELRGANVLLITLESVGRDYLERYTPGAARTPFLDEFLRRAVVVRDHACVVPNTTKSHLVMYGANYPNEADGRYLSALHEAGYQSIYLTTSSTAHWELGATLRELGVQHIIDAAELAEGPAGARSVCDYALTEQVPARLASRGIRADSRWLLHIQTSNTHVGYRVVDRQRFSRFRGDRDRGRFLNSIEEADWILSQLFCSMESAGLLDDTLVIVTADHGESFGEFGYKGHSNSVGNEQTLVPFLMHHPRLAPGTVARASHLDVLPTVLDLLGVRHGCRGYGQSIFAEAPRAPVILHSETVRRAVPTCVGLLHGDQKIMHDAVFDVTYELALDDRVKRRITGSERRYLEGLLRELLTARGTLSRSRRAAPSRRRP